MTKSIDDLLRDALERRAAAAPPTRCLDAETAAAFGDDTLPADERAGVEAHVADCARCQALLAAFARITPPPVARAWWRRPAIAWLAPLAVAATALIVWVNVPRRTSAPALLSSRETTPYVELESSRAPSAPASSSTSRGAPVAAAEPRLQASRELVKAAPSAAPAPAPDAKRERDRATSSKDAVVRRRQAGVPSEAQADAMADNSAAARPVAGAPPAPTAAAGSSAAGSPAGVGPAAPAPAAAAEQRTADSRLPSTPLPPAEIPPRDQVSQPSFVDTLAVTTESLGSTSPRRFSAAREPTIVSSNPISRWRIGTAGVVQHSADGGSTWQTQSTGVNVTLTAGASPSPAVCWLVGPAGVVLITTDEGSSWQRLPFPVAIDLVSVRATDDKRATVVTSNGRTFTTSDRGRTWR
jgi:hypothetical protein